MFREVLVDMKYEFGERADFNALLPKQWITDNVSVWNLNTFFYIYVFFNYTLIITIMLYFRLLTWSFARWRKRQGFQKYMHGICQRVFQ